MPTWQSSDIQANGIRLLLIRTGGTKPPLIAGAVAKVNVTLAHTVHPRELRGGRVRVDDTPVRQAINDLERE